MSKSNPIQYTSTTYTTILDDINRDPELADKPEWWKRIWAGVGDMLAVYRNAVANNAFLRTAFTRQAVADLAELLDYHLSPRSTATGDVLFELASDVSFPVTISKADAVAKSTGTIDKSSKRYEARSDATLDETTGEFTADDSNDELDVERDFYTGEKIRLQTSDTLPDGLEEDKDYWAIRVDETTIQVAESFEDAVDGNAVSFSDSGEGNHEWKLYSIRKQLYQQESIDEYVAERGSDDEWLEIDLADEHVLRDTLRVTINGESWSVLGVDTDERSFVYSSPSDQHVKLLYNTDGTSKLRFGNGTYGATPGPYDVYVEYAVGGGSDSNASEGRISVYAGEDDRVERVYNPKRLTGGGDMETAESAKVLAPILLKARDRFVTGEDAEAIALDRGGVSQVNVLGNEYGLLSAKVVCVANGGGQLSSGDQDDLQEYLIDRSLLGSIDVRVEDATFKTIDIEATVGVEPGYEWSEVEKYVELALRLVFTEVGAEIKDTYDDAGTEDAVELINDIFDTSFDSSDYDQIRRLLDEHEPAKFGVDMQESEVTGYVDFGVFGADYIVMDEPSFPVELNDDEITEVGSITLTEAT